MIEIHENDIGSKFLLTVTDDGTAVDISTAATRQIVFKKPSGEILTKTATLETTGTDGKLFYLSVDGDLDETGRWFCQAVIDFGSSEFRSSYGSFYVFPNLES